MRRVLVVEDDATTMAVLRATLRLAECDVTEAVDGSTALEHLGKDRFDLVLLDIMLPHVSGYEILEWIQAHGIDVPVVVVTSNESERGLVREALGGAVDHLGKPFGYEDVTTVIEKVLASSPAELQAQRERLMEVAQAYAAELDAAEEPRQKRGLLGRLRRDR